MISMVKRYKRNDYSLPSTFYPQWIEDPSEALHLSRELQLDPVLIDVMIVFDVVLSFVDNTPLCSSYKSLSNG